MNSPLGGTSLDTPMAPEGMNGSRRGFFGSSSMPFDPNAAPGRTSTNSVTGTRRTQGRRLGSDQGNSVEALLSELQTLLATKSATSAQVLEKLALIRATRAKAARDLQHAQNELTPLLTLDQIAVLVSLGYLD